MGLKDWLGGTGPAPRTVSCPTCRSDWPAETVACYGCGTTLTSDRADVRPTSRPAAGEATAPAAATAQRVRAILDGVGADTGRNPAGYNALVRGGDEVVPAILAAIIDLRPGAESPGRFANRAILCYLLGEIGTPLAAESLDRAALVHPDVPEYVPVARAADGALWLLNWRATRAAVAAVTPAVIPTDCVICRRPIPGAARHFFCGFCHHLGRAHGEHAPGVTRCPSCGKEYGVLSTAVDA